MNYTILFENSKTAHLFNQDTNLGAISYNKWFNTSDITIDIPSKGTFNFKKPSVWKSNFQIVKDDKIIFNVIFGWSSKTSIVDVQNGSETYTLKQIGFFSSKQELRDEKDNLLLEFTSKYNWKTFKKSFDFTIKNNFENANIEVLLFTIFEIINIQTRAAIAIS